MFCFSREKRDVKGLFVLPDLLYSTLMIFHILDGIISSLTFPFPSTKDNITNLIRSIPCYSDFLREIREKSD